MTAGFERHIGGRTPGQITGTQKRMNFRVGFASALMSALADNSPLPDQHAAHARIRSRCKHPERREFQGLRHEFVVGSSHAR